MTGLTLIIAPPPRRHVQALFYFYLTAENPWVPRGCFEMSGRYVADTGEANFAAGRWLLRPDGYVTVDLIGLVEKGGAEMSGIVDGPGCVEFRLHRNDGEPRDLPAACQRHEEISLLAK